MDEHRRPENLFGVLLDAYWTSLAHDADWAICLARTDPDVPQHQGITYFLLDMDAEGVDIRPLRELTGDSMFVGEAARPDISRVEAAAHAIAPVLEAGTLVVVESTVPVGTTERVARLLARLRPDLSFPHAVGEPVGIGPRGM